MCIPQDYPVAPLGGVRATRRDGQREDLAMVRPAPRCVRSFEERGSSVDDMRPVRGDLQAELLAALWRLGAGTVADVRGELPDRYRGAYTTVQTVLNRLAGRGLVSRVREGNAIVYRPELTEAEYLVRSIQRALAGASSAAREVALAQIVSDLADDDAAGPGLGPGSGRA